MKKLTFLLAMMFATSFLFVEAQVQTMHNQDARVTVTNEQIKAWGDVSRQNDSRPVVLEFEGLGNLDEIAQFYNGGTSLSGFSGINYGISFSQNALAIIDAGDGGTGNFTRKPLSNTVMFFLSGSGVTMNVTAGFTDVVSFNYTSSASGTVSVFDGPDGTGNLLASLPFQSLTLGMKGIAAPGFFNNWQMSKVVFSGMAKSVTFSCTANQCAFDDIKIGSDTRKHKQGHATGETKEITTGFISSATTAKTQTLKGKLFLAGTSRMELNVGGNKSKSGGNVVEGSESTYLNFDFQPKAGYYFINNLVGGLYMDVYFYNDKSKEETGYSYKGTTFILGPFARFYIPVWDKLIPFAEVQTGFGVDNSSSRSSSSADWYKTKESVFTYRLGGGATYFFNEVVGADLFMGFQHDSYKFKDTDSESRSDDSKSVYNEFIMQLGIVVILDL